MANAVTLPWNPDEVTGPELSTPELHGEGLVAPGQEDMARAFLEEPVSNSEEAGGEVLQEKILGKFESQEDLARAYQELEKKLGQRQEAEPAQSDLTAQPYTRDQAVQRYGEGAVEALSEKGVDLAALMWKADNGGDISEHYSALAGAFNVSPEVVADYVARSRAPQAAAEVGGMSDADVAEVKAMVGGDEAFTNLSNWAAKNLDAQELADYNAVVDSENKDAIRWALRSIQQRAGVAEVRRVEPKLVGGGAPASQAQFTSEQQVLNAMNKRDDRGRRLYDIDPAYREKVKEVLANSNVF